MKNNQQTSSQKGTQAQKGSQLNLDRANFNTANPVIKGGRLAPQPAQWAPGGTGGETLSKASLSRLEMSQLPKQKPDFDLPGVAKDMLIAQWLKDYLEDGFNQGKLNESLLLPKKEDLAVYLGVSIGTVQNAIRYVEDDGYVESKQRIGTVLRHPQQGQSRMRKQTSKRDQTVAAVENYISQAFSSGQLAVGQALPSAREMAKTLGSAPNTMRLAMEYLAANGTLHSQGTRGNKANWFLAQPPQPGTAESSASSTLSSYTLIDQMERDLKALIYQGQAQNQYLPGQKLPSHTELASQFQVSIKTVHDAMRRLGQQGIVQSKRGRYGTFVARPTGMPVSSAMEALFVPAGPSGSSSQNLPQDSDAFYHYQKMEGLLKAHIHQGNYKPGDKLPPMSALAQELQVSSNTVRKALQSLATQGYLSLSRGRYGGTTVLKTPAFTQ